jgi:tryptophan synthase alpha chain
MLLAMNRIERIFSDLRARGGKALMPFLTAGDPDLATTAKLLPALEAAGAHVVELGVPFSDPIADGPVIQASMTYALEQRTTVHGFFEMVRSVRPTVNLGLVAMVSYSIVHRTGREQFIRQAADAGIDGFIFPDLPLEEAEATRKLVRDAGLILSMLIAPTTPIERAEQIAQASSGFVYVLSRSGITGEQRSLPADLPQRLSRLRQATNLPMAVGFGISTAQQVREVVAVADAAIVGSAMMRRVAEYRGQGGEAVVKHVAQFTRELAGGLRQAEAAPR